MFLLLLSAARPSCTARIIIYTSNVLASLLLLVQRHDWDTYKSIRRNVSMTTLLVGMHRTATHHDQYVLWTTYWWAQHPQDFWINIVRFGVRLQPRDLHEMEHRPIVDRHWRRTKPMQQNKSPKFEYLVSPFHAKNPNGRPCNEQSTQFVSLHLNSNVPLFYEKPGPRHKLGAVK